MSSFIGAALPWMGGKMADLLGFQGEAGTATVAGGGGTANCQAADEPAQSSNSKVGSVNTARGSSLASHSSGNGVAQISSVHRGDARNSSAFGRNRPEAAAVVRREPGVSRASSFVTNGSHCSQGSANRGGSGVLAPVQRVRDRAPRKVGNNFLMRPAGSSPRDRWGPDAGEVRRWHASPQGDCATEGKDSRAFEACKRAVTDASSEESLPPFVTKNMRSTGRRAQTQEGDNIGRLAGAARDGGSGRVGSSQREGEGEIFELLSSTGSDSAAYYEHYKFSRPSGIVDVNGIASGNGPFSARQGGSAAGPAFESRSARVERGHHVFAERGTDQLRPAAQVNGGGDGVGGAWNAERSGEGRGGAINRSSSSAPRVLPVREASNRYGNREGDRFVGDGGRRAVQGDGRSLHGHRRFFSSPASPDMDILMTHMGSNGSSDRIRQETLPPSSPREFDSEWSPHRKTQLRAKDAARRFQDHRLLPRRDSPPTTIPHWPPPHLRQPSAPSSTTSLSPRRRPKAPRGKHPNPVSVSTANGVNSSGNRPGSLLSPARVDQAGPPPDQVQNDAEAASVHSSACAGRLGDHLGEAPVFSNGVLVPRPSLWAGSSVPGKADRSRTEPAQSAPQSRLRSGSGNRESLCESHGGSDSRWRSKRSTASGATVIEQRRHPSETGEGDKRGEGSSRSALGEHLLSKATGMPSRSAPVSTARSLDTETTGGNGFSGGGSTSAGGGRLAWIGDQRQLLQRPSATLQLRRHTAAASGMRSPSATAAAYLGRLDLVAASDRRDASSGSSGRHDGAWTSGIAKTSSPLPGSRKWSAGTGDRSQRNVEMRLIDSTGVVSGSIESADDGTTLSSSGVSVTSCEDSDADAEDGAFVEPSGGYGPGGSNNNSKGHRKIQVRVGSSVASSGTHRGTSDNSRQQRSVASVAAEAVVVASAANSTPGVGKLAFHHSSTSKSKHPHGMTHSNGGNRKKRKTVEGRQKSSSGDLTARKKPRTCHEEYVRNTIKTVERTAASHTWTDHVSCVTSQSINALLENEPTSSKTVDTVTASTGSTSHMHTRPRSRSRRVAKEPIVPQPPSGPRTWPARPPHRALVYAAAAEASRRARGFSGWLFPSLPPPPPPPPRPPTPPSAPPAQPASPMVDELLDSPADDTAVASGGEGDDGGGISQGEESAAETEESRRRRRRKWTDEGLFLGFAKDNPPGKPSPNEFGWLPPNPMLTPEGRAAARQRAIERVAERKRQAILEALRIKEEIAEARRKRKLNVLFLGMTRVAEYDCMGGLAKGRKRFDIIERFVRQDVDETNMNPLRDTARVLAMEALGHEVRCVSKVATPGESDSEKARSTRAKGGPTGLGRFLATDMTNTGASRGFVRRIEEKWQNTTFDTVLLDHYWLPDSVVWLNKGYMANDGGLVQNLVRMTNTSLLREDFEIMLPINQAFFELLLPHFHDLETHFNVEFLVGERLEHLKKSHLALEADELIPAEVMLNIYGKEREHQVSQMLGVKQPTADVAAILLRYGVAAQHFCYARFLKLTRNPAATAAFAASSAAAAAAEAAKNAQLAAAAAAASSTSTTTTGSGRGPGPEVKSTAISTVSEKGDSSSGSALSSRK